MVRGNPHPLPQIKAMRVEALDPGIEREGRAFFPPRLFHQPIKKLATETGRPIRRARDQIVHVKRASGKEQLEDAVAGYRADGTATFQISELETVPLLTLHLSNKSGGVGVMRPQLLHHRMTPPDLGRGARPRDGRWSLRRLFFPLAVVP